jgi:hypothetical protein
MPYVPNVKCDVFVSFATLDDEALSGDTPWVSTFVTDLKKALRIRLGAREDLEVYFTNHGSLGTGLNLKKSLAEMAQACAAFVAVTSPAYVAGEWTMFELNEFQTAMGSGGRVFAIEYSPLDRPEDYPAALGELKRAPFWKASTTGTPMTLAPGSELYRQAVLDLTEQIKNQLKMLKEEAERAVEAARAASAAQQAVAGATVAAAPAAAASLAGAAAAPSPHVRTVFLAQVMTDDLEEDRDQVRRYLEQYSVPVVPASEYPLGGVDFTEAVTHDLSLPNLLFVQLLGRRPAKRPPDLPAGYDKFQCEMAASRNIPILQWIRPDVDIGAVTDAQHQALLSGEHVRAVGLEAFKKEVLQKAIEPPKEAPLPIDPFIFINADKADLELAQIWREAFKKEHIDAAIPVMDGPAEEVRRDLEERLMECDALLMIYGKAEQTWARAQAMRARKLKAQRREALRHWALCFGPPPRDPKPDLGVTLKDLIELDCTNGVTVESVRQFLAGLRQ